MHLPPVRPFSKRRQRELYGLLMDEIARCEEPDMLHALATGYATELDLFRRCEALPEDVKHHHGFDWWGSLQDAIAAKQHELTISEEFTHVSTRC